jgi:hypothetical protein
MNRYQLRLAALDVLEQEYQNEHGRDLWNVSRPSVVFKFGYVDPTDAPVLQLLLDEGVITHASRGTYVADVSAYHRLRKQTSKTALIEAVSLYRPGTPAQGLLLRLAIYSLTGREASEAALMADLSWGEAKFTAALAVLMIDDRVVVLEYDVDWPALLRLIWPELAHKVIGGTSGREDALN